MKFIAVLAFAAATSLATPTPPAPPPTFCAREVWDDNSATPVYLGCPSFTYLPESNCRTIPGDPTKKFPDCCDQPVCGEEPPHY